MGHSDLLAKKADWTNAAPNHTKNMFSSINADLDEGYDDSPAINSYKTSSSFESDDAARTKSDTSSELQSDGDTAVKPMLEILSLSKGFDSFVIDSQAGLTGSSIVAQFPCVLDQGRFFIWLGATEFSLFGKTTLMNLANLAESKGAETLYLVMDRDHFQLKDY